MKKKPDDHMIDPVKPINNEVNLGDIIEVLVVQIIKKYDEDILKLKFDVMNLKRDLENLNGQILRKTD